MSTRPGTARAFGVIAADVLRADCGECWVPPHVPCLRGSRGMSGYHVARFARAYRRGLISAADLTAALDDAEVFGNSTVVYVGKAPS